MPSNLQKSRNFSSKLGYCLCTSFDFKAILNLEYGNSTGGADKSAAEAVVLYNVLRKDVVL